MDATERTTSKAGEARCDIARSLAELRIVDGEDFDGALKRYLDEVGRLTGWELGHAFILSHLGPQAELVSTRVWSSALRDSHQALRALSEVMYFSQGSGIIGRMLVDRRTAWTAPLNECASEFFRADVAQLAGFRRCVIVPVCSQARLKGTIEFFCENAAPIDPGWLAAIETGAAQLTPMFRERIARRSLARVEARFHASIDGLMDPMVIYGVVRDRADDAIVDFRCEYVNLAAEAKLGWDRQSVVGHSPADFYPRFHKSSLFRQCVEVVRSGRPHLLRGHRIDVVNVDDQGTSEVRLFDLQFTRITDGVTITFHDVTELKERESQHREQQRALARTFKLQAMGEMTAGIAHEINNPLTVIVCQAYAMRRQFSSGVEVNATEVQRTLRQIEEVGMRIRKIIEGLKNVSGDGDAEAHQDCALGKLVADTLSFCQGKLDRKNVELAVDPIRDDLTLRCQAVQISEVLLNLLNNAFDAVEDAPTRWIRIEPREEPGWVELRVSDSGRGVAPELADRIFDSFYTTKGQGKGTGLGLALSRQMIEKHGGTLTLDAEAEHTTFVVRLPQIARQPQPDAFRRSPPSDLSFNA